MLKCIGGGGDEGEEVRGGAIRGDGVVNQDGHGLQFTITPKLHTRMTSNQLA